MISSSNINSFELFITELFRELKGFSELISSFDKFFFTLKVGFGRGAIDFF